MASPFSYLSSPESDEFAIAAIISEATDLCALEHIASLNTSHLSDSSLLPADLDARFRKLKSFPVAKPHSKAAPKHLADEKENVSRSLDWSESVSKSPIDAKKPEVPIPSQEFARRFSFAATASLLLWILAEEDAEEQQREERWSFWDGFGCWRLGRQ